MNASVALIYSFLFGLLHGILPDEHTWPITFSYAIGSGSGKEGMKAGLFFSAAFTIQRTLLSELAYLALAPFLLTTMINGIVYIIVGLAMSAAGGIVLRRNHVPHLHLFGFQAKATHKMDRRRLPVIGRYEEKNGPAAAPPLRWTIVHGFIAGFGFGGFSLFVNTAAAPAMPSVWLGFLPGLLFGVGTMISLVAVGALFGASLRWAHSLNREEIKRIGARTGGRTLLYGGWLFTVFGIATLFDLARHLPVDAGYVVVGLFMVMVAFPAFVASLKEVQKARKRSDHPSDTISDGKSAGHRM